MSPSRAPHVLVEIDGDEMVTTVAEVRRRTATVLACRRGPFAGWDGGLRDEVVRSASEAGFGTTNLHVVLDGKGFVTFELNLPRLSRAERVRVAEREARSRLALADHAHALVGLGSGNRLPNGLTRHPVLATSSDTLQVLQRCLDEPLLRVRNVVRRDDALALVLADDLPSCVVCLRVQRGGLRCELVEDSTLKSGRRIELEGWTPGEAPSDDVLAVLRLEIRRTLEYFADLGLTAPKALAIDPAVGLTEHLAADLEGEVPVVDLHFDAGQSGELEEPVPPATLGLLRHLTEGAELIAIEVERPEPSLAGARVMACAIGLLLVVSSAGVVGFGRGLRGAERELAELRRRAAELAEAEVELELRTATGDRGVGRDRGLHALVRRRRPVSRLIADVAERVPPGVLLDELAFDDEDAVTIGGTVPSTSRLEAIRQVERLREGLRTVPFLALGREVVSYDATEGSQSLSFRIEGRWKE